jgi:filamentous hemagglutinin family protein
MQTRADLKPVARGGVIGLGLGKFVFVGGGVAMMLAATCWAGPQNAQVAAGKATIRQRGNTTVIRASDRAIINYSGFDIARNETVRFIQPGASSTVLNRIQSARPTTIDGTLKANGHVYLLNPNGIMFSGTSVVDTGGLTAAAASMSNKDFLAGNNRFTDVRGDVVNQGTITTTASATLIGQHVANSGVIDVGGENGVIAMIAGDEVTLTPRGDTMSIKVANNADTPAPTGDRPGVENTGRISAGKGRSVMLAGDVYSLAVRNTGTVRARNIKVESRGQGEVQVSGTLDASARGVGGTGGTIDVTGSQVTLSDAKLDARGARGGGDIRVNDSTVSGQSTSIDAGSVLTADATRRGDGGTVVVDSGGSTEFHGTASARGGTVSGDGGAIETSGSTRVNVDGSRIDAGADAAGAKAGSWLVDPTDFTVNAGNVATFNGALDMGMDVTIETGSGGADLGNVTVDAAITKSAGSDATLTLRAENDVIVNQAISSSAGALNVDVQANTAGNGNMDASPDQGAFTVNNDGATTFGSVNTNGGTLSVAAADVVLSGAGATVTANGGVTLTANGSTDQSLGLGGGTGAFKLSDAEMQLIVSTGDVAIDQLDRTDAVDIGTLTLGATAYNLSVTGGTTTVGGITMGAGNDLTLVSENSSITGSGTLDAAGGVITLRADDLAMDAATVTTGTGAGTVKLEANAGRTIGLDAAGDFSLSNTELNAITTGTLQVRSLDMGGAGDVGVGSIAPTNIVNFDIITGGRIDEAVVDNATKITLVDNMGTLTLTSGEGIGAAGTSDGTGAGPLDIDARTLDASVSGTGGMFIKGVGNLTVAGATTADGKISIRNTGTLDIQGLTANESMPSGRTLELVSGGAMTSTGTVTANGSAYFQTTGADQDISIPDANVATAMGSIVTLATTGSMADASIVNAGAVALSGVDVGGNLSVTAGGAITQTDAISAGGDATFITRTASGAAITLEDTLNEFGHLTARARDVADTADADGDISIFETDAAANVMDVDLVSTTGSVRLVAGDVVIDTGTVGSAITAGMGGISLEPINAAGDIAIGTGAAGDFQLNTNELLELASAGGVTIGRSDGIGQISIGGGSAVNIGAGGYDLTLLGGPIVFNNTLTLGTDRQLSLIGGAISNTNGLGTPDVVLAGDGKLLVDSTGAVNFQTVGLRKLAARSTGASSDIALTNTGAGEIEITTLGAISGVTAAADGNITLVGGGPFRVSQGIATSGTGSVVIDTENVAGNLIDNVGMGQAAITVGPAGSISLTTASGEIRGTNPGDAFNIDTGAASGSLVATVVADATTGINIANAGTGGISATLNTTAGEAKLVTGGGLTTGPSDWTADSVNVTSGGDLVISRKITTDAGDISLTSSTGLVDIGEDLQATNGNINLTGSDVTIRSVGSLTAAGASGGDVTIARSTDGGINVGGGTFGAVSGITEYLTVDNDELNRITADTVTIGDANHTQFLRVQNVQDPDATNASPTADRAHQSIGSMILRAEGASSVVRIAGDQGSFFKALDVRAGAGIEVARDVTATVGGLTLDADTDMADGTPGSFFTTDHDVLTFTGGRILTTLGAPADSPDVTLRGRRAAGETGIAADNNLTINSTNDVIIGQSIDVTQTLTLDADGEVQLAGGGNGRRLDVSAKDGIRFTGDVSVGADGMTIDADSDNDDAGTFAILSGTVTLAENAGLRIQAADVQIDGSIAGSSTSDIRIGRSNSGDVQVGAFVDNNGSNDLLTVDNGELSRITARNLTIGNFTDTGTPTVTNTNTNNITVDGVTASASDNISGLVTLDAGMALTFSGAASTFNQLTGIANDDITVSSNLTTDRSTGGDMTLTADSDSDESGSLAISGDIFTKGSNFTASGGDLALTGHINTAADMATGDARGDVLISSARDSINVNNNGADDVSRMTITDAELQNIVARNFTVGSTGSTTVNVRDISATDGAGIAGTFGVISGETVNLNGASTFAALDVQARQAINVNGNLTTTTGDLSLNANTNTDDIGRISINGVRTLTSAGNLTLSTRNTANNGIAEGTEAGGALTLNAVGNVQLDTSLTSGDGTVTINADSNDDGTGTFGMVSTGSIDIQIGDLDITAADINLPAATSGNGQIMVESGSISIDRSSAGRIVMGGSGSVAGAMTIESSELRKIQGGTNLTIGGNNTSRLDVRALSASDTPRVSGEVQLRALADGGADNPGVVKFNNEAHSFVALDAQARSLVKLDNGGTVTTTVGGISLDVTQASGSIELGGSMSASSGATTADIDLKDKVLLTRNATLTARRDVHLFSTVDSASQGGERSLTVDAGRRTIIDANIGATKRLSGFGTAGPTSTTDTGRVTRLGGNIYTNDGTGIRFRNAVTVTGSNITLQDDGQQGVYFYTTVNGSTAGGQSLTVITDLNQSGTADASGKVTDASIPLIVFGGSVGQTTALKDLNLNVGTRLRGNNTSQAVDGHTSVPLVSTIVARRVTNGGSTDGQFVSTLSSSDNFSFTTTDGFTMGQNEKLSGAGNVTVTTGAARLSDMTAFGGIAVNASSIAIRSRPAALLAVNGTRNGVATLLTAPDLGVDFVANSFVNFNRAPSVEGTGPAPTFGTASGERSNNNLSDFLFRKFSSEGASITAASFQNGTGANLVNLDLTSSGPTDTNFAESIAGFIPRESRFNDVGQDTTLSQALFTDLTQLGVNPRNLGGDERLANLVGWSTYDDYPERLSGDEPPLFTTVNRLPDERTRDVVRQYRALVTKSVTNPETGQVTDQSQKAAIKKAFEEAVKRYRTARNQPTGEIEPVAFREYIDRSPAETEAKTYADQLAKLLRDIELLGLVGKELTLSKQQILRDLRPSGLQTLRNMEIFVRSQSDQADVGAIGEKVSE